VPNHLDRAKTVFVVDAGSDNARFRTELRALVGAAGCGLVEFGSADVWMQDCMEFGYAAVPGSALRTVLRAPRPRPLQAFPRRLLGPDLGYVETGSMALSITFNSTGNLEATPPVTVGGKRYPFGRVYYGPGVPGEEFDADVREFLRRQTVQDPIELNTRWLTVGHVDEVISFVPAPGARGFKLLLASPRRAYAILDGLRAAHGGNAS
jgi:protein-arginine deiminase